MKIKMTEVNSKGEVIAEKNLSVQEWANEITQRSNDLKDWVKLFIGSIFLQWVLMAWYFWKLRH
jgi:hypothetical protein